MTRSRIPPLNQIQIPPDPSRKPPCSSEAYERLGFIGHGSYGMVTKAKRISDDSSNLYAIKTHKNIDSYVGDQIKYRFINELLMLSSSALLKNAESDFIIQLQDWFIDLDPNKSEQVNIVMDYCPMDLHTVMSKYLLTISDVQFYIAQIILGLDAIHDSKIVHNDLKPENVLLDQSGNVKITDFGISELCNAGEKKRGQYGTQIYMAPETLNFRGHDHSADYFSLGVMLYEMVNNELPFQGQTTAEIIRAQKKKLKFKDSVPIEARDLIKNLLTRSSHKRSAFASNIKNHPFFDSINWDEMKNKTVEPPFNPTTGVWKDDPCGQNSIENDGNDSGFGSSGRKRGSRRDLFLKLARSAFVTAKKAKKFSLPGTPQLGVKSKTDKITRRCPVTPRLLYRSLNRFSLSSTRSSECDQ